MKLCSIRLAAWLATAGLAVVAAPAVATEGPSGGGQPLRDPLQPVTIQPSPPAPSTSTSRPRVTRARVVPRRVRAGHRSRLRITLAMPGKVRIVIDGAHAHPRRAPPRVPADRALPHHRGCDGRAGQPLARRAPLAARGAPLTVEAVSAWRPTRSASRAHRLTRST
jgi:hypothetical protein